MKMYLWISVLALSGHGLTSLSMATQDVIDGRWEGAIVVVETELRISVTFETTDEGLTAKIDIPQQGAIGLALTNVVYDPPKVHFELPAGPGLAVFDGELRGDTIAGEMTQAGVTGEFSLRRAEVQEKEPPAEAPIPYLEEEVRFQNGEIVLAGTLTLPPTGGPHPAVIMITGSGPQNRDEELLGFKPFRLIADHLARKRIATFRYDDRGVGGSTGSVFESTTEEFAGDVLAAVRFLQGRADVDPKQIGLLGHSEGGIVASLASSRCDDVAFIILLASPGVSGEELLYAQGDAILRANGASEAQIEAQKNFQRALFRALRSGEGWDSVEQDLRTQVRGGLDLMPTEQRAAITDVDAYVEATVKAQLAQARSPWFRFYLDCDPVPALEKLRVPVLAVFGELDLQVPPSANRGPIVRALQAGASQDYTVRVLPAANHLFQAANTGSPSEYSTLEKEFVPGFLELVTGWIVERTKAPE